MKHDFQADNNFNIFNRVTDPRTIVDVELLDDCHILLLFPYYMKFVTCNGEVLSLLRLENEALSLGRHANRFIVPCLSKRLFFVKFLNSQLFLYIKIKTEVQISGACAASQNCLMCIAMDKPTIYIYDGLMCVQTVDLAIYGVDICVPNSSRRIRRNQKGYIAVSDYKNNFVLLLWDNGSDSTTYKFVCPSNITLSENHVYITQDAQENRVSKISLTNHKTICALEERDGVVQPKCVSVNNQGMMLIGMDMDQTFARVYQINDHET